MKEIKSGETGGEKEVGGGVQVQRMRFDLGEKANGKYLHQSGSVMR